MKKRNDPVRSLPFFLLAAVLLTGCSASRNGYDPKKKYAPAELQADFSVFRGVLQTYHPGLYWFTPKEEMNQLFDEGFASLNDSMDETEFLNRLSYIASGIRCGHTLLRRSRAYVRYQDTARARLFPLNVKVWPDSMAVTSTMHASETVIKRGTIITAINDRSVRQWTDTLMHYISSDGYSMNGRYQALSNTGSFAGLYRRLIGEADSFSICYKDDSGFIKETRLPAYVRSRTGKENRSLSGTSNETKKKNRVHPMRYLAIDTAQRTAIMTLNTFSRGNGLHRFFRKSFRSLHQRGIENLLIDVRANGGGDAGLAIQLSRYLVHRPFRVTDSLYALANTSTYGRYIDHRFVYTLGMRFITKKKDNNRLHFGYFERHQFPPMKRHRFDGSVYLVTGGNSFSATTVFLKMVQGEKNITVVGEETGGGRYGNSAWMLPQVTLPKTGLRFTLPLFRMVMDKTAVAAGTGILPDVWVGATPESIRNNEDPKIQKVFELITERKKGVVKQTAY